MHIFFTPQASSYDRFIRTAEETKWVEKLLMTMPRKKVTDGCKDEDILSLSTAWLLKYLAKRLPDVYENVSKKVGFRKVGEQKMTAKSQAAMIMEESEKRLKDLAKGAIHDINKLLCIKLVQFVESADISIKALIKVLLCLCIDGIKLTKALEYTVAEIECDKDTAVIFDKTIAGPINSVLDAISKS
eukprot:2334654-Ditylum_brightwellii.AAC.1